MESLKFRYQNSSPYSSLHESISLFHEEFSCQLNTFSFLFLYFFLFFSSFSFSFCKWILISMKGAELTVVTVGALGKNMDEFSPSWGTQPAPPQIWKWWGSVEILGREGCFPFSPYGTFFPAHPKRKIISNNFGEPLYLSHQSCGFMANRNSSIIPQIVIPAAVL